MFKCTHCEHFYDGNIYTEHEVMLNVTDRMLGLRIKEDDICPMCGDGVLRPIKKEQPSVRT